MAHITKALVERARVPQRAKNPSEQETLITWDDELRGLGLRVSFTGRKVFIFQTRVKRRLKRITLGEYPYMTVAQAREKVFEMKAAIGRGEDPTLERKRRREEPTFADLSEAYLKDAQLRRLKSVGNSRRQIEVHCKSWMTRAASDIQREDVARLHAKIAEERGQVIANRIATLTRTIYNRAIDTGLFKGVNPAQRVRMYREHARTRFLTTEELMRVNRALQQEPNLYWRSFFTLLLLLGPRKNDLLAARWADIDRDAGTWRIPTAKTGRENLLPLPEAAQRIFDELHKLSGASSEWVFPSTGSTGHLAEPRRRWLHILERAKVSDVTIHDLRRTLGSFLASSGQSLPMIGRVLGHRSPSSTAIYAHLALDSVRKALEDNARLMLGSTSAEHDHTQAQHDKK